MSDDAAIAALMTSMTPASKAAKAAPEPEDDDEDEDVPEIADADDQDDADEGEDDDTEEGDDDDAEEGEEGEEGDEAAAAAAAPEITDDHVLKVKVNGEEQEFTVGNLKRLAGQEASLTRKSQEAELVGSRAALMIQSAVEAALQDMEPYKDVDWLSASRNMDPEEFDWHRENFRKAEGRYNDLIGKAEQFEQVVEGRRNAARQEQAAEALTILQDPEKGIPGWNDELYGEIMQFGIEQGLDADDVAQITSAPVLKLLHMAMSFQKGKAAVAAKVPATPAKVRKGSSSIPLADARQATQMKLEKKVKAGGSLSEDDAMAVLQGRWRSR